MQPLGEAKRKVNKARGWSRAAFGLPSTACESCQFEYDSMHSVTGGWTQSDLFICIYSH